MYAGGNDAFKRVRVNANVVVEVVSAVIVVVVIVVVLVVLVVESRNGQVHKRLVSS